jgi:serum/glucocorticoid-regulated kinase 2
MEKIEPKDNINFKNDKDFKAVIKQNENLLWSGESLKINCRGKRQNRVFLVTDSRIINVGKRGNFLLNIFSKLIKREIDIMKIEAVTYSSISNNFVLHVPSEYDYYLSNPEKDEVIYLLIRIQNLKNKKTLKIYMVEDIDLDKYSRKEGETVQNFPTVIPVEMDAEAFAKFMEDKKNDLENNIKNTQTILSRDGNDVNENDFEIISTLGKGYFGKVFLVEKKIDKKLFALKVISKLEIVKKNFFDNLKNEKNIMEKIKNPFVVNLEYCFATPAYVFFVMKFKQGGELYYHLRKQTRFSESIAKFYACQILSGLIYLHDLNIMYRDMKAENILLDKEGNAALADFGISKILDIKESTKSFVGTPEYVAPEIILQTGHNKAVDIWCFGILLYEMVYGLPPFYNKNQNIMLNWILKLEPTFPKMIIISDDLKDLIKKCLQKEPEKRIGFKNTKEILEHPWFNDINWKEVNSLTIEPPIKPVIRNHYDVDNFNKECAKEDNVLEDLKEEDQLIINNFKDKFDDF